MGHLGGVQGTGGAGGAAPGGHDGGGLDDHALPLLTPRRLPPAHTQLLLNTIINKYSLIDKTLDS